MKAIFDCHRYSKEKKVKLASVEFMGYISLCWNQLCKKCQGMFGGQPIRTWAEMKAAMRDRFIPFNYKSVLHNYLQDLKQGTKTVDEYYKELEKALILTETNEPEEATMFCFLNGLHRDILQEVELRGCQDL